MNRFFDWGPYKGAPLYRHLIFPAAAIRTHLATYANGWDEVKGALWTRTSEDVEILIVEEGGKRSACRKENFSNSWLYNNLRYFRKGVDTFTPRQLYCNDDDDGAISAEHFMEAYILALPCLCEKRHAPLVDSLVNEYRGKRTRKFDGPRLAAAIIVEGTCYADGVFGKISGEVWEALPKINEPLYKAAQKKIKKWHNEGHANFLPPGYERMF